jgi:hypothetical protein
LLRVGGGLPGMAALPVFLKNMLISKDGSEEVIFYLWK